GVAGAEFLHPASKGIQHAGADGDVAQIDEERDCFVVAMGSFSLDSLTYIAPGSVAATTQRCEVLAALEIGLGLLAGSALAGDAPLFRLAFLARLVGFGEQ